MSKMTVPRDGDTEYKTIAFVEFLEAIGRIAKLKFQGTSRGQTHTLAEKIEYTLDDILEVFRASEATRCQLVEVFRLMSEVFRLSDTTAATVYEEVKRCTTASDIGNTRLSKAVRLQQEVLLLKDVEIMATCFEGCHYQPEQDADASATATLLACPCNMQRLLHAVPGWYALAALQDEVVGSLSLVFEDITTSMSLAGLRIPRSALQGDTPSPQLLEACMDCKSGHAKPVDAVLQSASGNDAWPGDSLVDLACAILQMLAKHDWPVSVAPHVHCDGRWNHSARSPSLGRGGPPVPAGW